MADVKTKPTNVSVTEFLDAIADEQRRQDCYTIMGLMKKIVKAEPKMWGSNIVGVGDHHYKYESGREGDWMLVGFAARKDALVLYGCRGDETSEDLLARLGKYKTGKGCLYIKKLADVDLNVLQALIKRSVTNKKAQGSLA